MTGRPAPRLVHILVEVRAEDAVHPALERALALAAPSAAALTIVDVERGVPATRAPGPAADDERRRQERRARVAAIAQGITAVPVRSRLLAGAPADALVREAEASRVDLIVRASAASPGGLDAADVALLRASPCPVLLQRQSSTIVRPVVGAVNATTLDPAERALGGAVVDWTRLVARLEQRASVLLQAWEPFAERRVHRVSSDDGFASYVDAVRTRVTAELHAFVEAVGGGVADLQMVLRRGVPERAIPDFARAHGVDLVVMGTMGRGGLSGLLIGNTAEKVLRALSCSVLVVKASPATR